jgi:hypothetical protein
MRNVDVMKGDTGTLHTLPGELSSKGIDIVRNTTFGKLVRPTYKQNLERHYGFTKAD